VRRGAIEEEAARCADLRHHDPVTDVTPRLATSADNAALLDLFGDVPMRGELVLATRRDPDFFALYRQQLVAKDSGGHVTGVATVWNPQPVKRFEVRSYNGKMRWVKRGYDLAATVLRWPKLRTRGRSSAPRTSRTCRW